MKPQRFFPGQGVTPNRKQWAREDEDGNDADLSLTPRYGEIYHVLEYNCYEMGGWWINLEEFPDDYVYFEEHFDPVVSTNELKQLLETVSEPMTVL